MSWVSVLNGMVMDFRNRPMQVQVMDADLEGVFKPIVCPKAACGFSTTNLKQFRAHALDEHGDDDGLDAILTPESHDASVAEVIMGLLNRVRARSTREEPNPLEGIIGLKNNDGYNATEVWRRAYLTWSGNRPVIKMKSEQYEWLKGLLSRTVPLSRDEKERGKEQQTVAMFLYDFSEDNVCQALRTEPERRRPELDPDEEANELASASEAQRA